MKWCVLLCMLCQELLFAASDTPASTFDDSVVFQMKWPGPIILSDITKDINVEHLFMTSVDQEQYHCFIPPSFNQQEHDNVKSYEGPPAIELLKPLFTQVACSYRLEQFWTYELCHGRFIRQFHEENTVQGKFREEYYLGKHDLSSLDSKMYKHNSEANSQETVKLPTVKVEGNDHPYLMINMTDGTECELVERHRHARVIYVCYPEGKHEIYSLKEVSTCEYEIVILSNLLCAHPAFRVNTVPETDIYCHPVKNSPNKPRKLSLIEEEVNGAHNSEPDIKNKDLSMKGESFVTASEISNKPVPAPHDVKLIDDLLQGEYCLRGGTGWWKYEFCYGRKVEQYHEDSRTGVRTTILLGTWNADKHLAWIAKNPQKRPKKGQNPRQASHLYTDGNFCEEIHKPRYVEVKLKCKESSGHPNAVSLYLLEAKTCEYILSVESPILCPLLETVDEDGLPHKILQT